MKELTNTRIWRCTSRMNSPSPYFAGKRRRTEEAWRNRGRLGFWVKERRESEELNIKTSIAWKHKKAKAFTVSSRRHTPEKNSPETKNTMGGRNGRRWEIKWSGGTREKGVGGATALGRREAATTETRRRRRRSPDSEDGGRNGRVWGKRGPMVLECLWGGRVWCYKGGERLCLVWGIVRFLGHYTQLPLYLILIYFFHFKFLFFNIL